MPVNGMMSPHRSRRSYSSIVAPPPPSRLREHTAGPNLRRMQTGRLNHRPADTVPMDPECIAINRTLDSYTVLYTRRDLDGVVSLVEPDFQGYGTGPDEVIRNADEFRRAVERDFAQTESATICFSDRRCTVEGSTAWVMGGCRFSFITGNGEGEMEGRFTAVLRHYDGVWRLAQLHLSIPCQEQSQGESWPSAK